MREVKKTYSIKGMHCSSCVMLIEGALREVSGVKNAQVNYASEKATIEYDPALVSESQIESAVDNVGYKITVSEDLKTQDQEKIEKQKASAL